MDDHSHSSSEPPSPKEAAMICLRRDVEMMRNQLGGVPSVRQEVESMKVQLGELVKLVKLQTTQTSISTILPTQPTKYTIPHSTTRRLKNSKSKLMG